MSLYLFEHRQVVSNSSAHMPNRKRALSQRGFCPAIAQSGKRGSRFREAKGLDQAPACALVRNWVTPF